MVDLVGLSEREKGIDHDRQSNALRRRLEVAK